MRFSVEINYVGEWSGKKSDLNSAMKKAFEEVGIFWHQKIRPKHFSNQAFALYGYLPRNRKYWWRKVKHGKGFPLYKSGEAKMLSETAVIAPTRRSVRVRMPVNKLNYRHPNSQINMAKELSTIAPSEYPMFEQVLLKSLRKTFRSSRNKMRVVIGGI